MAPGRDATPILENDAALAGGEWLFRRRGEVFGPVDSRTIAVMLYRGEIDPGTPVSPGDGTWTPVGELPIFLLHAKKAEAALRVEREVTGARLLRARRSRRAAILTVAAVAIVVAGAAGIAYLLAQRGGSPSPLLEDFGADVGIVSAARVGASRRVAGEDGIELPRDAPAPAPGAPARSPAGPERPARSAGAAGSTSGGDALVQAHYDPRRIQAVVAREQRTLVPCFRAEAARSPELSGEIPIEFAIGNDGRVATLWIDDPRFRKGPLETCLRRALDGWRFESFPGERPTVSLAFRIGR